MNAFSIAWPTPAVMSLLATCVLAPIAARCAGNSDYVARSAQTIRTKADPASRRTQLPVIPSRYVGEPLRDSHPRLELQQVQSSERRNFAMRVSEQLAYGFPRKEISCNA